MVRPGNYQTRLLEVTTPVAELESGTLDIRGAPGEAVLLFVTPDFGWQLVPSKMGVVLLGSAPWYPVPLGAVGPDGLLSVPFTIPAGVVPGSVADGIVVLTQAVHLNGGSVMVVIDASI